VIVFLTAIAMLSMVSKTIEMHGYKNASQQHIVVTKTITAACGWRSGKELDS